MKCRTFYFLIFGSGARHAERVVSGEEIGAEIKKEEVATGGFEKILERNNQITSEWSRTSKQQDKFKLLEIQSNAEKG